MVKKIVEGQKVEPDRKIKKVCLYCKQKFLAQKVFFIKMYSTGFLRTILFTFVGSLRPDPTLSFEPQVLTRHQFAKYVCNRRRSKRAEIIYKEAVVSRVRPLNIRLDSYAPM